MNAPSEYPIAILGAGPIGLAAAAHLTERELPFVLFEAGQHAASSMRDWGHVRMFTPWSYLTDPACDRLLQKEGFQAPFAEDYVPYARELVEQYLEPVAQLPSIRPNLYVQHKVVSVTRDGHDRMKDGSRSQAPFLIVTQTPDGARRWKARAVLDASGTWSTPNPMGAAGIYADGEREYSANIRYGMPDIAEKERTRYAGKRILVVGSGHSAIGSILSLAELAQHAPETQIAWAIRRTHPSKLWGGGSADELSDRGALGTRVYEAVHSKTVHLLPDFSIHALQEHPEGLQVVDTEGNARVIVDEIIVATGSRPDLTMLRELRLEFDLATEATQTLGPLIDPNHHSCGSVMPHGALELKHPEKDFYTVGMKSYGRAPTFLLRTGYEQVRSVAAELAGDYKSARNVELVLPQTGVCSTQLSVDKLHFGKQRTSCC